MQIENLVKKLLNDSSVDEVLSSLQWISLQNDPILLDHLADTIISQAISNPNHSPTYLNLAKLTELSVTSVTKEEINFKDVFMKKSIIIFQEMERDISSKSKDNLVKAQLLGYLFNVRLVSTVLISYWLNTIQETHPEEHKIILETIADQVEIEFQRPIHDKQIDSLIQLMQERGIIQPKQT